MIIKRTYFYLTLITIFSLIYILNLLYPLLGDDWTYSFIYGTSKEPVKNLSDIFLSQYNHYFGWGGRSIVHILAQLLLLLNTKWADLLNSFIFILFLITIYKISNIKKVHYNTSLLLFLWLIMYLLVNTFISCTLWLTVSTNYLWGSLIILLFIYPYYQYFQTEKYHNSTFKYFLFILLGIISGWTNENMFIAQIFIISGIIWLLKKQNKKIPEWFLFGFAGLLIGGCFLLLAPGNYERVKYLDNLNHYTFSEKIKAQFYESQKRYINQILPLSSIYIILLIFIKKRIKNIEPKIINGSLLFFLAGQIAWITMIASPTFPSRATFGIVVLIICAIGILYANIELNKKLIFFQSLLIIILLISFSIKYCFDFKNISLLNYEINQREKIIIREKQKGNLNIILYDKIIIPAKYGFEELSENPDYWLNKEYSAYYNINSVKLLPEKTNQNH